MRFNHGVPFDCALLDDDQVVAFDAGFDAANG
jgi:hypothetical protein